MTTSDHNRETLRQARADAERVSRSLSLQTIPQERGAALERAGELFKLASGRKAGSWLSRGVGCSNDDLPHHNRRACLQGRRS